MTVYLHLFHGRERPEAHLEDWGFNGPTIGPLNYVHTTYANHIKLGFVNEADAEKFGLDPLFPQMHLLEDLLEWNGKYYGDWSVAAIPDTGFYQLDEGECQNLTLHDALDLFEATPEAKHLWDVGSGKPYLVKGRP